MALRLVVRDGEAVAPSMPKFKEGDEVAIEGVIWRVIGNCKNGRVICECVEDEDFNFFDADELTAVA